MPHDGKHFYPIGTVMELLKAGVINHENCRWGVRATRSIEPKILKGAATTLQDCVTKAAWEHTGPLRNLLPRHRAAGAHC